MLKLPQSTLEKFLTDPVMAAYVLLGFELDTFQAARLRTYWWVPNVIDSSGVSTGKTIVQFCYINLRVLLLPKHVGAIYFPNFQTGKDEFWPYFQMAIDQRPVYASHLKMHNGKLGEHKDPGAWWMEFKDNNRLTMPAPGFMQDSQTSASRRFNTLVIDDYLRAMDMGDGIEKQLADRVTRPCFNQHHPVWSNHTKFLGHAERPTHKGYQRYMAYKRSITDGSTDHAVISFCHLDWSEKPYRGSTFKKQFLPEKTVKEQRKVLPWDQYCRQWLGIWSRDGSNFYPDTVLIHVCRRYLTPERRGLLPVWGRQYDDEINVLGFDVARGASIKADWCAAKIYRMIEIKKGVPLEPTRIVNGVPWHCSFTFAHMFKNADTGQVAAFIHLLDSVFGLSKIALDPGGGGLWIYPDLKKEKLLVDGVERSFVPLCTRQEAITSDKRAIVEWFKRGGDFDSLIEALYLVSEEGFIHAWHLLYRQAWEGAHFAYPLPIDERDPKELRGLPEMLLHALRYLSIGLKQLNNIRQLTDKDGHIITSRRGGFPLYRAVGKKDVAYSGLFAFAAGELMLRGSASEEEEDPDAVCLAE